MEIADVKLMGQLEIQQRLGVSRHRTYILVNRYDFPRPRWELGMGRIWWAEDVEAWIREKRPHLDDDPDEEEEP